MTNNKKLICPKCKSAEFTKYEDEITCSTCNFMFNDDVLLENTKDQIEKKFKNIFSKSKSWSIK